MLKIKTKIIMTVVVMLLATCLFNLNSVNATELTQEELQDILNNTVPDIITLDIPESEYVKGNSLIKQKVREVFPAEYIRENGLDVRPGNATELIDRILYSRLIQINVNTSNGTAFLKKEVRVEYNNTKDKNSADEQYIKNLKLESPRYYKVKDIGYLKDYFNNNNSFGTESLDEQYYTNLINDKSITIQFIGGEGGLANRLNLFWRIGILLIKDNMIYDARNVETEHTIPVIVVPNNVSDGDLIQYVTNVINMNYTDTKVTKVVKGLGKDEYDAYKNLENLSIPNLYTVYSNIATPYYTGEDLSWIIIDRENPVTVSKTNATTNIKLQADTTAIPENTVLKVESIISGDIYNKVKNILKNTVTKMSIFDISIERNNVKIQPKGKVKISIPIPNDFNTSNLVIYRVEENGETIEYEVTVETIDGIKYATFETDHFSTYVLAEESKQGEKDETPKTGTTNNEIIFISLITIIGIAVITKNTIMKGK